MSPISDAELAAIERRRQTRDVSSNHTPPERNRMTTKSYTVTTETGYSATLSPVVTADGTVLVKASTRIRNLPTPSIAVKSFKGPHRARNLAAAHAYCERVVAAIMDGAE